MRLPASTHVRQAVCNSISGACAAPEACNCTSDRDCSGSSTDGDALDGSDDSQDGGNKVDSVKWDDLDDPWNELVFLMQPVHAFPALGWGHLRARQSRLPRAA